MKWLLWLGGALLLVIVVVLGVGAALPVAHTATASATLPAPPDRVWAVMTDIEAFPSWREGVDRVTRLEDRDGLPRWREEGPMGSMTLQVTEWEPPRRFVARIADEGLPFGGSWTYQVEPFGQGTRVTLTEDGEVYNPVFRFMSRYVFGHDATMKTYLAGLEERFSPAATPRAP